MRRVLICLGITLLLCAQSPITAFPPGLFENRAARAPAPASYSGPGDVVSGARIWWGLRAYSAAKAGTKAISLCDDTGANCADESTSATTGKLIVDTRGSNDCTTSDTCRIQTFYDQSSGAECATAAPCDVTQATNSKRAVLIHNCPTTGLYCARFASASSQIYTGVGMTTHNGLAQPLWFSAATKRSGTAAADITKANSVSDGYAVGANIYSLFAGSSGNYTLASSDGNFRAIQAFLNGSSSGYYIDGNVSGTLTSGASTYGSNSLGPNIGGGFNFLNGDFLEVGIWNGDQTASNAAMNTNQHSFWGF